MTLGHEVAGVVEQIGAEVDRVKVGDRVALHYNVTCAECYYCSTGSEQFCPEVRMLGHHRDGGYAEYVAVPARNAIALPEEIPFEQGATLMCASATAFHVLRKARLKAGETVAVFGVGGLGMSAVQLARAFGALDVYAVDINEEKLATCLALWRRAGERSCRRCGRRDTQADRQAREWTWRLSWSGCPRQCGRLCSVWASWAER